MLKYIIIFILFCVLSVNTLSIVNPGPKYPPTKGEIWPKPQFQKKEQYYYTFNPSKFSVKVANQTCDILQSAVERYSFIIRSTHNLRRYRRNGDFNGRNPHSTEHDQGVFLDILNVLNINLKSPCENYPYFGMDESYDLTVSTNSTLSSSSIWGILRGLESWSQLFYLSDDYNEVRINKNVVMDFPRYPHRGLLLDTSRHFVSLSNILKTINAMAINKMNVFHWHIVDDQSFPYQSEIFPELSRLGAFHHTMVYTKSDIEMVVEYARDRGIRVLPEFDVPGHTRSWGNAYPNILTKCYNNDEVIGLGPMDPTKNVTYKLLGELINEVQQWFPDKYFHVGGDEVELDCWNSNPDLQKYMKEHNLNKSQLHGLFMEKVIPLLGNKSQPIVWQEVFDEGVSLSKDTIVQVWKWGWVDEMIEILNKGHRLIFSSSWYLDHLASGGDWSNFYFADPREMVFSKINKTKLENIVGGEACMWGEVVDDTNVISRVWPRTSAVAERLWSAPLDTFSLSDKYWLRWGRAYGDILVDVSSRIEEHTCRMRRRGISAQPPNGPGFCVGAV